VTADWQAPPERAEAEVRWLKLAGGIDPDCAPQIRGEDPVHHMFAMRYLPPDRYRLWKTDLAAGRVDVDFARVTGTKIAGIHAATAGRHDIARRFDNGAQFFALRLDAYLLFTAARHPDLAARISAVVDGIAAARIALMQGDISPKNILQGPDGPVFLDAETACYGDPVFDIAFCANHLLLKCVWHPEHRSRYLESFAALTDAWLEGVSWERAEKAEGRAAILLAMLLLARVDGKSPVEYLAGQTEKQDFVRRAARAFILAEEKSLAAIADRWRQALDAL
jgi:aminoglycoside phosphotransferase (APT) family kinase protein